jgi:hypothetical protein
MKLARGAEHLHALNAEGQAWVDRDPYRTRFEVESEGPLRDWLTCWLSEVEPPPPLIGVLTGDWAHNARSALDLLVWALVRLHGKVKPGRHNTFPIYATPNDWETNVVNPPDWAKSVLKGVDPAVVEIIEKLQPYYGRNPNEAKRAYLWSLKKLNNADKHRTLQVSYGYRSPANPVVSFDPPIVETKGYVAHVSYGQRLGDHMKLVSVLGETDDPQTKVEPKLDFTVSVAVGEQGVPSGRMFRIHEEVIRLISNFDRAYFNPVPGFVPDWTTGA